MRKRKSAEQKQQAAEQTDMRTDAQTNRKVRKQNKNMKKTWQKSIKCKFIRMKYGCLSTMLKVVDGGMGIKSTASQQDLFKWVV